MNIFVNKQYIRQNQLNKTNLPCIEIETEFINSAGNYQRKLVQAHEVIILGQDGKEAGRVIYSEDEKVTGQRVWVTASNIKYRTDEGIFEKQD